MAQLNCIAVDDEPLALTLVCKFIEQTPFLSLAGKYSSAIEALKALHSEEIQVIFMDIQMPDLNGMELARILNQDKSDTAPRIIFTSAYNNFALESYKVDALDYLLKPFNYDEFLRAAQKAKAYFERIANNTVTVEQDYLFLKVEFRWVKVFLNDILYVEGVKDYVKVHLEGGKNIMSLNTMKNMEEKLPSTQFMRVNRSYIISLSKISAITKTSVQINDMNIPVGESHKEAFVRFIKDWIK